MTSSLGIILAGLLVLASGLLYWHLLGYPLLMSGMRRKARPAAPTDDLPFVSVVVPVFNEERNLGPRVQNLLSQDYPNGRVEIVIVESGSTDGTAAAARDLEARVPNLKVVVQPSRLGKASAIAAGKAVARGAIIVVTDANTAFDPTTLRNLVHPFGDPAVGGVGGRFVPRNANDPEAAGSALYWSLEEITRAGEAALDSSCTFHGEVYAWRKDLVEPDGQAIIDDLDSAIQIRRKGHRIGYSPDALAHEAVPTSLGDMATQWRKNALGAIQCTFRNLRFLVGTPSFYTYLIYPSHKVLQILQPFLIILGAVALVGMIFLDGLLVESAAILLAFLLLSLCTAGLLFRAIARRPMQGSTSLFHPLGWIRTFVAFQYAVLLAWKDYVLGRRDVRWTKVESTRV